MAKNNKLINGLAQIAARNRAEHVRMASERDTPQIYAALAIALWKCLDMPDKDKAEAIGTIFAESQAVWVDCVESGDSMVRLCEELTGIDVVGKVSE